jgi:NADH:ubiquinone reductase (H+-translocating)
VHKKSVVIIGGGFAGLHVAKMLSNTDYKVLLIDRENHHMFQPLFYQVATARLEPSNISFPFRKIFQGSKNVEFRLTEVTQIRAEEKLLLTSSGSIHYDVLIIATGCKTNFFGNELLSANAFSMKTTQEAIAIRNAILLSFERFITATDNERTALLNLVIVGAGPTGVELAGAFSEMKKNILPKDYPNTDFAALRIIVVEGSAHTLNNMSDHAKKASEKYLRDLGVELYLQTVVKTYDGQILTLTDGTAIPTTNVIWAAGVTGNILPGLEQAEIIKNRYVVNRFNGIGHLEDVYAIGDIAYMVTPKYHTAHPQLANVAINQAKNLARNLLREKKGLPWQEYEYKDLGSMATIGKRRAVADLPFLKFDGRLAWFAWMFLHLMLILSVRNKLKVFINWSWHYFTNDSSLRLIFREKKTNL